MPKVKFLNEKKEIEVETGANLRQVALANDIPLHHHGLGSASKFAATVNCSALPDLLERSLGPDSFLLPIVGGGFCGTCHVYIKKGTENCSPKTFKERCHLAISPITIGHEEEVRLACQTKVLGDIEVETHPPTNLFGEKFW
jgi:ferredoxin